MSLLLADFTLGDLLWSLIVLFFLVIWFWLLITIFSDLFRSDDLSGWAKALWVVFILFFTFIGMLIYLIVRGNGMTDRAVEAAKKQQQAVQQWANDNATAPSGGSAADEIAKAKGLLDSGAITQDEFEKIKAKNLG